MTTVDTKRVAGCTMVLRLPLNSLSVLPLNTQYPSDESQSPLIVPGGSHVDRVMKETGPVTQI